MQNKKQFSILLVDDYREASRLLRNVLKSLGFSYIDDAPSGPEALHMMRKMPYNMVISDWNMEPMNGLDLFHEMRTDPQLADTIFIMITGMGDSNRVEAARRAGIAGFILKPFSLEVVRRQITTILSEHNVKEE
jgi:two-component system chemotaxis response regulator CheY